MTFRDAALMSTPRPKLPLLIVIALLVAGCSSPREDASGIVHIPDSPSNETANGTGELPALSESRLSAVGLPQAPKRTDLPAVCLADVSDPSGDIDSDGLSNAEEKWWYTDPAKKDSLGNGFGDGTMVKDRKGYPFSSATLMDRDSDLDGIPDLAELCFVGTDSTKYDTDGDGYGDGLEYFRFTFASYLGSGEDRTLPTAVRGGPFQPDVADIIVTVSQPKLELKKDIIIGKSTVQSKTFTNELSTVTTTTERQSETMTDTTDIYFGAEVSAQATLSTDISEIGASISASAKTGVNTNSVSERSHGWEQTSATTVGSNFAGVSAQEWSTLEQTDIGASEFSASLEIRNIGNDLLRSTMNKLLVNFYLGPNLFYTWDSTHASFTITNLAPNTSVTAQVVKVPINADQFRLFAGGMPVTARVVEIEWGSDQEILLNAKESAVQIDVDYGTGEVLRRYVAVKETGAPLLSVYNVIGRMVIGTVNNESLITSIDGRAITLQNGHEALPHRQWAIQFSGAASERANTTDVARSILKPGDHIVLKYGIDSDGDGLSDTSERLLRTDPNVQDTDGDGLTDAQEARGVFLPGTTIRVRSNPLVRDTNANGHSDKEDVDGGANPSEGTRLPRDETPILSEDALVAAEKNSTTGTWTCRVWQPMMTVVPCDIPARAYKMVAGQLLDPQGRGDIMVLSFEGVEPDGTTVGPRCQYLTWNGTGFELVRPAVTNCVRTVSSTEMAAGNLLENGRTQIILHALPNDGDKPACILLEWQQTQSIQNVRMDCSTVDHVVVFDSDDDGRDNIVVTRPDGLPAGFCFPWDALGQSQNIWNCGHKPNDQVATGDVLATPSPEFMIWQHETQKCEIQNPRSGVPVKTFACPSSKADVLMTTAKLIPGDEKAQIIMMTPEGCFVYAVEKGETIKLESCARNTATNRMFTVGRFT